MARAGSLSLQMLGRVLAGERQIPRTHRLPTQLIVRDSTGPATAPPSGTSPPPATATKDAA